MKPVKQTLSVLFVILAMGLLFHYKYINEFPSHIHAWAQADRYALALGFIHNNFNFFKPETFVLNPSFPNGWRVPISESITAVDFPAHEFIAALVMKVTDIHSPWIFRLYILLYSFAGLLGLFKLTKLLTGSFAKSFLVVVFTATSPVFVYYQGGFLPSIPSFSNAIIGIYFYTRYLLDKRDRDFYFAVFFLTLAALCRISFSIPLISMMALEFIRIVQKQTRLKPKLLPVILSASIILAYFFYNSYLKNKYGTIFLSEIRPAASSEQAIETFKIIYHNWFYHYFTKIHYSIIGILTVAVLVSIKIWIKKITLITQQLWIFIAFIFVGSTILFFLMINQYRVHDYYFFDTFLLPVVMSLIFFVSLIKTKSSRRNSILIMLAVFLISIPMIIKASRMQSSRRIVWDGDRVSAMIQNYQGSDAFLDSIGVPDDAKMLVLGAYAPNIPGILMDRKSYLIMHFNKVFINEALLWDFDFIVTENEFFITDFSSFDPENTFNISKVADNGRITIWKYIEPEVNR